MGFCLVNCWLSRSGLTLTLCAPTFMKPEFHDPIFHTATQAARDKQNINPSKNLVSALQKRASPLHGLFMIQLA
jgi:hypothetical protein